MLKGAFKLHCFHSRWFGWGRLQKRLFCKSHHITGATHFGASAAQSVPPKGLRADNRADLVAIDLEVSNIDLRRDSLHTFINAAVESEGKPKTTAFNIAYHSVYILFVKA